MPRPRKPSASAARTRTKAIARRANTSAQTREVDTISALRGLGRLAVDAVVASTDLAEHLHRTILDLSPIVGTTRPARTRGITGVVYGSVRTVARAAGGGVDVVLKHVAPKLLVGAQQVGARLPAARMQRGGQEAVLAAINGVVGDHLHATGNPLAIPMRLRVRGEDAMQQFETSAPHDPADAGIGGRKLMLLLHGLCMNDLQWQRDGHDHGEALADALGYTPLYLHYNSGRHISANGREFATLMQALFERWPTPIDEIAIVGHSMGGLIARSACEFARQAKQPWLGRLKRIVFLGTPHHGAPLERVGNRIDRLLRVSPYTAPFARLGQIRSAGVQDLRYSNLRDEDWAGRSETHADDARTPVALPEGVHCYALAATTQRKPNATSTTTRSLYARLRGDGLVAVNSALGIHEDPEFSLPIPHSRRAVAYGVDHFDLLASREVYARMHDWLKTPYRTKRASRKTSLDE
jgi:pimeloyl-ACP methyl ester carboxylesterase